MWLAFRGWSVLLLAPLAAGLAATLSGYPLLASWTQVFMPSAAAFLAQFLDWVLGLGGGPLVSLAVATNILAAMTGSASGGLSIALEALGPTYRALAEQQNIDPGLMHRVAAIGAGTLDILPHNGAVVTLLALCGVTHRQSYLDIAIVDILPALAALLAALLAVIALGSVFGGF